MLRVESGGLSGAFVRAVAACDFPALERLDLWLGVEEYGGDSTVADLAPILTGDRLPALKRLGLQDSEHQDEIAAAVASAPIVARLDELDLSMGTLSDEGAEALLDGQPLTHLSTLDLHHHFLSEAMAARVGKAFAGVGVNLADGRPGDDGFLRGGGRMTEPNYLELPSRPEETDAYEDRYAGLPTADAGVGEERPPGEAAWHLYASSEKDEIAADLDSFFEEVASEEVRALTISLGLRRLLPADRRAAQAAEAHRLPALRAIFLGAIPRRRNEISRGSPRADVTRCWPRSPIWNACDLRGDRVWRIPPGPAREAAHAPGRERRAERRVRPRARLVASSPLWSTWSWWLGVPSEYNGDYTVADLGPILTGDRLPALRHLGLQDGDRQDDVVTAVATAPVVARLGRPRAVDGHAHRQERRGPAQRPAAEPPVQARPAPPLPQ